MTAATDPSMRPASVIVPAFNREACIQRAVRSALLQTYPIKEVLVVDDGSTDRTCEVVAGLDDPRIRIIRMNSNSGAPAARNQGLDEARGEYVALLDSDDEWDPMYLESVVRCFPTGSAMMVSGFRVRVDNQLRTGLPTFSRRNPSRSLLRLRHGVVSTSTFVLSRPLVESGLRFDVDMPALQDLDFAMRAARRGALYRCSSVRVTRHVGPGPRIFSGRRPLEARLRLISNWRTQLEGDALAFDRQRRRVLLAAAPLSSADLDSALQLCAEGHGLFGVLARGIGRRHPAAFVKVTSLWVTVESFRPRMMWIRLNDVLRTRAQ